jgi:hypothetical protein
MEAPHSANNENNNPINRKLPSMGFFFGLSGLNCLDILVICNTHDYRKKSLRTAQGYKVDEMMRQFGDRAMKGRLDP